MHAIHGQRQIYVELKLEQTACTMQIRMHSLLLSYAVLLMPCLLAATTAGHVASPGTEGRAEAQ